MHVLPSIGHSVWARWNNPSYVELTCFEENVGGGWWGQSGHPFPLSSLIHGIRLVSTSNRGLKSSCKKMHIRLYHVVSICKGKDYCKNLAFGNERFSSAERLAFGYVRVLHCKPPRSTAVANSSCSKIWVVPYKATIPNTGAIHMKRWLHKWNVIVTRYGLNCLAPSGEIRALNEQTDAEEEKFSRPVVGSWLFCGWYTIYWFIGLWVDPLSQLK